MWKVGTAAPEHERDAAIDEAIEAAVERAVAKRGPMPPEAPEPPASPAESPVAPVRDDLPRKRTL